MSRLDDARFRAIVKILIIGLTFVGWGCARLGNVRDSQRSDFYQIPRKLPGESLDFNPHFIIYGDNRPGWRISEVLGKKQTWLTWKQLYLPIVYQAYLVGTGVVGGVNYVLWNPDYGNSNARMVRDAVYARAGEDKVDFIVNTGDIVTDGRRPRDWKRFIDQYREEVPVVLEYPYLPVSGNHDRTADSTYAIPNFTWVFSYPLFYVLECPDVDFFILDSNFLIDQHNSIPDDIQEQIFAKWFVSPVRGQPSWLERKLAESTKAFKVIVIHHPLIASSEHYDDWNNPGNGPELLAKRAALLSLFEREGVQLVFSGHEHCYARNTLSYKDSSGERKTISFVVTGGGGAPLRSAPDKATRNRFTVDYAGEGYDVTLNILQVVYNYCVVDVRHEQISLEAIEVSKEDARARKVIDRFVVTRD